MELIGARAGIEKRGELAFDHWGISFDSRIQAILGRHNQVIHEAPEVTTNLDSRLSAQTLKGGSSNSGSCVRLRWTSLWRDCCANITATKFVRDVGLLAIANFVGAALNLAQGILIARWLDPELYGVAGLVMVYPALIYGLIDARSAAAAMKYFGTYHALGERLRALAVCKLGYAMDVAAASLALVIVVLSAHMAARSIVHDPSVAGLMTVYGMSLFPRALVGMSNALLVALGRSPLIALIEMAGSSMRAILVIGLVLAGWQVEGVVWANAAAAAALGLCYVVPAWVLIRRACGASIMQGSLGSLKDERRQILAFFTYNNLHALISIIPQQIDSILLGYFRGATEVGYYRLAKNISSVVEHLRAPLFSVSYAQLARIWGLGQEQAFRRRARKMAFWVGVPSGLAVLSSAGLVPFALPILVGDNYSPAIGATQLLLLAAAVSLPFLWVRAIYLVKNLVRELFIISAVVTIGFVSVYPFVVWQWGYIGACGAMLVLQVTGSAAAGLWLWKQRKDESSALRHEQKIKHTDVRQGCGDHQSY
jgi:O-antigen/teichoic acid export membrane protein